VVGFFNPCGVTWFFKTTSWSVAVFKNHITHWLVDGISISGIIFWDILGLMEGQHLYKLGIQWKTCFFQSGISSSSFHAEFKFHSTKPSLWR
jgi:hypothetical protein